MTRSGWFLPIALLVTCIPCLLAPLVAAPIAPIAAGASGGALGLLGLPWVLAMVIAAALARGTRRCPRQAAGSAAL